MDSRAILIETIRLLWRHRIAASCLVIAASIILTMWTSSREPKTQMLYTLAVNGEVARPASLFQMIADFPAIRAHKDDLDGDGLKWRVNARRTSVSIPGVTNANELEYKKVMAEALQAALQRLNTYSMDVIETSEASRSASTGNAHEFSRDVLKAKLFGRYFDNNQKMIAYFNIDTKGGFVLPTWLIMMLYILLCFGLIASFTLSCAVWRRKMPEFLEFFRTEITKEGA